VTTLSTSARYLLSVFATVSAAAIISGCGGSSGVTPAGSAQLNPDFGSVLARACRHHGAVHVKVDPCTVDLTASNPGPTTVAVYTRKSKKGTFAESDNCGGASGMATVTQGSGDQWIVTAGLTTGSCTATFAFQNKRGKTVGTADLSITNSI
jgi:hypothetical protein